MQIRVAEERDAATLLEIYSYYVEKTAITFEYETPSIEEFTQRIHDSNIIGQTVGKQVEMGNAAFLRFELPHSREGGELAVYPLEEGA